MQNEKEKNEKIINNLKTEENKENINDVKNIEKNNLIQNELINSLNIELKKTQEEVIKLHLEHHEEIIKLNNRLNGEIEKSRKFSLEKVIIEFLPIIDNIERALSLIKEKEEKYYLEIVNKLDFIFSLLDEILSEFNVTKINEKNVLFNPDIHQAMSIDYNNEIKDNYVVDIMQYGYMLYKSRLLRPAMVIVSKNKK